MKRLGPGVLLLCCWGFVAEVARAQGPGGGPGGPGGLDVLGGFGGIAQMFGAAMAGGNSAGRIASPQVIATSDDRANALIVSASAEQIAMIDELVRQLNINVDEITELRVFHLKHADPGETANQLATLFPNTTSTTGQGGRGQQFQFGGGPGGGASTTTDSGRLVKQMQVTATADYRTGSLIVSASRVLMPQIAQVIEQLDADPSGQVTVVVFPVDDTDPQAVLSVLQGLIPSQSGTVGQTTSGQTSSIFNRTTSTTGTQNRNTSGLGGGTGGSTGGGTTSGGFGSSTTGGTTGRSDRNLKDNFAPVDTRQVLAKVASLPIISWHYKDDATNTRHLGPMAQDFYSAFGIGTDDKTIGFLDEGGVALAAVQGLNQKVEDKDAKIQALAKEVLDLKALVQMLVTKSGGGVGTNSGN